MAERLFYGPSGAFFVTEAGVAQRLTPAGFLSETGGVFASVLSLSGVVAGLGSANATLIRCAILAGASSGVAGGSTVARMILSRSASSAGSAGGLALWGGTSPPLALVGLATGSSGAAAVWVPAGALALVGASGGACHTVAMAEFPGAAFWLPVADAGAIWAPLVSSSPVWADASSSPTPWS